MTTKKIIFMLVATIAVFGCKSKDKTQEVTDKSIPVKVEKIEKQKVERTLEYSANLVADEQVNYVPSQPGRINKIHVEVGDRIRKGQLLVTMDQTSLKQAEVQLSNLKSEYDRAVALKETESISQQAYDGAVTQYEVAATNVKFLKENAQLLAPFDGVVTGKYFEDGEMYSGMANTSSGKAAIITIEKVNPLKAIVGMTEQFYPNMKVGTPVELRTSVFADRTFNGKVKIVYPTIDPATRSFQMEITIPNNDGVLKSGMSGTIRFYVGEDEAITVPAICILKLQGANSRYVFINDGGKAKRVDVTLGQRFDDRVEIISDMIKEGTEIITTGQAKLVDGSELKIEK